MTTPAVDADDIPVPPWADTMVLPTSIELLDWINALPPGMGVRVIESLREDAEAGKRCWHFNHGRELESLRERLATSIRQRDAAYAVIDAGTDVPPALPMQLRLHARARVAFELSLYRLGIALAERAARTLEVGPR